MIIYERKDHPLNQKLGSKFSVFQSIYNVPDYIIQTKIEKQIFPRLEEIVVNENLEGLIIKYNISEKLFYSPTTSSSIIKLYEYNTYLEDDKSIENSESLILRNGKLFKTRIN